MVHEHCVFTSQISLCLEIDQSATDLYALNDSKTTFETDLAALDTELTSVKTEIANIKSNSGCKTSCQAIDTTNITAGIDADNVITTVI